MSSMLVFLMACGGGVDMGGGVDSRVDDSTAEGAVDTRDGPSGDAWDASVESDGGFDVGNLPGLALWLDAAKGISKNGQNLAAWADLSKNKNDAAQTNPSLQPAFVASSINGLPAVHFSQGTTAGTTLSIQDSASLHWGMGDFLVVVVARFDNDPMGAFDTGLGSLFYKPGAIHGILFFANRFDVMSNAFTSGVMGTLENNNTMNIASITSGYNDGKARSYAFRRNGPTLELRVLGAVVATTSGGGIDVSAPNTTVWIGADSSGQKLRLNGGIAEIVAVKGAIAPADLMSLEAYLATKYKL